MYILLPWGNNHPGTCTGTCIVYDDSMMPGIKIVDEHDIDHYMA